MTTTIILTSGIEAEIKELMGLQQDILTKQDGTSTNEKIDKMLSSCIVRIGDTYEPSPEFIKSLLQADKKKLLLELRMASTDNDPLFVFEYTYEEKGQKKTKTHEILIEHEVEEIDPTTGESKVVTKPGLLAKPYYNARAYTSYSEIDKVVKIVLPKSKKEVHYTMLDGAGSAIGAAVKKTEISTHTPLLMRQPKEIIKTENGTIPTALNLNTLPLKDIEYLRKSIKDHEGDVESEFIIKHPVTDAEIITDMLAQKAFFFPSQAL